LWREWAQLLASGLGLVQAIALSSLPETYKRAWQADLAAGQSLSFMIKRLAVTDFERALIQHGEGSGTLAAVFSYLAEYLEYLEQQRQSQGSQWLPLFLILGAAVWLLPLPSVVGGERRFFDYVMLGLLACGGLFWLWRRFFSSLAEVSVQYALPWGKAFRHSDFCQLLSMAYAAGLPLDQALFLAARGTFPKHAHAWQQGARQGQRLTTIVASSDLSQATQAVIRSGEAAGRLDEALAREAESLRFDGRALQQRWFVVGRLAVYGVIAAVVAWQVIQFYQGYLGALP
jgi:type II secretory pathway component PulF